MYNPTQHTMLASQERIRISVQRQSREVPLSQEGFYEGIYALTINQLTTVIFTPAVDDIEQAELLSDDDVTSPADARILSTLEADFIIMPDDEKATSRKVLPSVSISPFSQQQFPARIVMYVTHEKFTAVQAELDHFNQKHPWIEPSQFDREIYPHVHAILEQIRLESN